MCRRLLPTLLLAAAALPLAAQPPDFQKVMITEVYMGGSAEAVELTNFGTAAVDLGAWTLRYLNTALVISNPIGTTIAAGETIVVGEFGGAWPTVPPGAQVIGAFPLIGSSTEPVAVGLFDAGGGIRDEVRITGTDGSWTLGSGLGGVFRGFAVRSALSTSGSVERIWGLDSDSGRDWTEQPLTSMGRENLSSGPRGSDTSGAEPALIRMTEIDDAPDCIEIRNLGNTTVALTNWFFVCSGAQGQAPVYIRPFPGAYVLLPGVMVVFGEGAAPAEKPASVPYVDVSALGFNFPFTTEEYTVALYDGLGRLADMVRVTGQDDGVTHNHPRAPSAWNAFDGAVQRVAGATAVARLEGTSARAAAHWRPVITRTMGLVNDGFTGSPGFATGLDVRANEGRGDGLVLLFNAGPAHAGERYSFLLSFGHLQGTGPFLGLGPDALSNWLVILASPPFSGFLDAQGAARVDVDAGAFPPGFDTDNLFLLQNAAGAVTALTAIVEFDT